MSVDQIHAALDTLDATPRDGFLDELEDRLVAMWAVDAVDDLSQPAEVLLTAVPAGTVPRRRPWWIAAAAAAAAAALVAVVLITPGDDDPPTVITGPGPTPSVTVGERLSWFTGRWMAIDSESGPMTMGIERVDTEVVDVTIVDGVDMVCFGASSTTTGTGRLDGDTLVVANPSVTCDDDTDPARLGEVTITHDAGSDTLTDSRGVVWSREGTEVPGSTSAVSGDMWPQSSVEEARAAQARADAGDASVAWQSDPELVELNWLDHLSTTGSEIVTRFVHDQLGWEEFLIAPRLNGHLDGIDGDHEGTIRDLVILRCALGRTNPLYPGDPSGGGCAPTIDDLTYEAVSLDLSQPTRQGAFEDLTPSERAGIWVVSRWSLTAPFRQTDPRVVEERSLAAVEAFVQARLDGAGADGRVEVTGLSDLDEVPLLYAASTGTPYERYEVELVGRPEWPDAGPLDYRVRLFADGGQTVVEQELVVDGSTLALRERSTTENDQPVPLPYTFVEGQVTLHAPPPWRFGFEMSASLVLGDDYDDRNLEVIADPVPVGPGCEQGPAPADAGALVAKLQADPDLMTTEPVSATVSGLAALVIDVTAAPDAEACTVLAPGPLAGYDQRRSEGTIAPGSRMRIYVLDNPAGSPATRLVAIVIVAPEARFATIVETVTAILDTLELRAG